MAETAEMKRDVRLDRVDDERHGAHRARRLSLAHLLHSGDHRSDRARDVDRHLRRPAALSGHRRLLRGNGEALSRHRQLLLLRRAVVPQPRQGVEVCAALEVHRRLGLAPLLLDLSRRDGRRHGHPLRLPGGHALAELHERLQSWPGVHDGWLRSCSPSASPTSPIAASTARRRSTSPSTSFRSPRCWCSR